MNLKKCIPEPLQKQQEHPNAWRIRNTTSAQILLIKADTMEAVAKMNNEIKNRIRLT
jgi:hypothetical protein